MLFSLVFVLTHSFEIQKKAKRKQNNIRNLNKIHFFTMYCIFLLLDITLLISFWVMKIRSKLLFVNNCKNKTATKIQ